MTADGGAGACPPKSGALLRTQCRRRGPTTVFATASLNLRLTARSNLAQYLPIDRSACFVSGSRPPSNPTIHQAAVPLAGHFLADHHLPFSRYVTRQNWWDANTDQAKHSINSSKEIIMTPTGNQQKRVLLVMSSVDEMGISGKQTGTWFHELAAPYYILTQAGYEVVFASTC
jgi:hypothetical protein